MTSNINNGSSSSDTFINSSGTEGSENTETPTASTAAVETSSDLEVFDGEDFLTSSTLATQIFSSQQWGSNDFYSALLQYPILLEPDPDGAYGPQPFDSSWQKATNKYFQDKVKEYVQKKAEESGETLSSEEIESRAQSILTAVLEGTVEGLSESDQKIVSQATQETQEAWSLSDSWFYGTKEATDWTPITTSVVAPVDMGTFIKEVIASNIEELLTSMYAAAEKMLNSTSTSSTSSTSTTSTSSTSSTSTTDSDQMAVADFIRIIAAAISLLKEVLRELQVSDAENTEKISDIKFEALEQRFANIEEAREKREKAAAKRRKAEKTAKIMKIVSPVVSATVILIGVIALPFTAGASTALIVAGLSVSTVMMAYTIVDATCNTTAKLVTEFNNWLKSEFPDNAMARNLIKGAILAAAVIIIVALIVFTAGGAALSAASVATQTTAQVAMQVAMQAAKQIMIQFTIMFIMASNILPELTVKGLIACGAIDKNDEKAKMIAQIVVMALMMVATMGVMAKSGLGTQAQATGLTLQGAAAAVKNMATSIQTAVTEMLQAAKEGIEAAIQQILAMINNLLKMLAQMGQAALSAIKSIPSSAQQLMESMTASLKQLAALLSQPSSVILENIKLAASSAMTAAAEQARVFIQEVGRLLNEIVDQSAELYRQLLAQSYEKLTQITAAITQMANETSTYLANIPKGLKTFVEFKDIDWATRLQNLQDTFRAIGLSTEVASAVYMGVISLELGRLTKDIGELEKTEAIINLLIKLLTELLNSFQEGISARGTWLNDLSNALDSLYAGGTQILNKATQTPA